MSNCEQTTNAESVRVTLYAATRSAFGQERNDMEFWENEKKIAFTTKPTVAELTTNAGYVWEKNGLTGPPYKYTASFVTDTDARVYLTAKYPHAVEKITSAVE